MGAVIARATIQMLLVTATLRYVGRCLGAPTPIAALLRISAAALCCGVAARLIVNAAGGVGGLAMAIPSAALIYFAAIRALRALPSGDVDRIAATATLLPHRLQGPLARLLRKLEPPVSQAGRVSP
jgi:hypothetical protein